MPGSVPTFFVGGVECAHNMPDGRFEISESAPAEGPQVSLALKCAWSDRWALVQALRGYCFGTITAFTGATFGGSTRPLSSEWVMISPPMSRVLTPQLVCQT